MKDYIHCIIVKFLNFFDFVVSGWKFYFNHRYSSSVDTPLYGHRWLPQKKLKYIRLIS